MSIPNYKFQGTKQGLQISTVKTINTDPDHLNDSFLHQGRYEEEEEEEDEDEDDEEELIRVVLRPKYTSGLSACFDQKQKYCEMDGKVRKTFSMRSADEQDDDKKQSSSVVERAVRRAFSMRASSASVNEVYRRIDHRYDQVLVGDEEIAEIKPYKKRNNKIFEACRRFFGF